MVCTINRQRKNNQGILVLRKMVFILIWGPVLKWGPVFLWLCLHQDDLSSMILQIKQSIFSTIFTTDTPLTHPWWRNYWINVSSKTDLYSSPATAVLCEKISLRIVIKCSMGNQFKLVKIITWPSTDNSQWWFKNKMDAVHWIDTAIGWRWCEIRWTQYVIDFILKVV